MVQSGGEKFVQLGKGAGPAPLVIVAGLPVEKALVTEVEFTAACGGTQFDRDKRNAFRGALPRPGERQLAVFHHLFVVPGHRVLLAVRRVERDVIAAAGAPGFASA